jgi:hypothetical protein
VYSRKKIALNYLKGYFITDLVSSVPVGLITSDLSSINKVFRVFRLPKFVKIFKFRRFLVSDTLLYHIRINEGYLKTVLLMLTTAVVLHIFTCIWCFLGLYDVENIDSWVYRAQVVNESNGEIYSRAIFFLLYTLTTVGYGEITPYTNGTEGLMQLKCCSASSGCC